MIVIAAIPAALDSIVTARLSQDVAALIHAPAVRGWQVSLAGTDWQPIQGGADAVGRWRFTRDRETVECMPRATTSSGSARTRRPRNAPAGLEARVLDEFTVSAGARGFVAQEYEQRGVRYVLWRGYQVGDRWFAGGTRAHSGTPFGP